MRALRTRRHLLCGFAVCTAGLTAGRVSRGAEAVTLFAAASLSDVAQDLARRYEAASGVSVRLSLAASSTLARQVAAGAPADVIWLASPDWADWVEGAGLLAAGTRRDAAGNRLALIAPAGDRGSANPLIRLVESDGRVAIGDPDHVPAGAYARAALTEFGLWDQLAPRLARADNVRAALALVARGEAPLGLVYATDAAIEAQVETVAILPEESHAPIRYPLAILEGRDSAPVRALHAMILGEEGRTTLIAHGFSVPHGA
ncbi:MAG: molybdate ABC transporter substrate-binding protein [Pseudomonadota bacterium]